MVRARTLRSLVLRISLLAFALQGMTPDAHDLASPTLWRIARTVVSGLNLDRGRETPPADFPIPDREDEELADEVCSPPLLQGSATLRDPSKSRPASGPSLTRLQLARDRALGVEWFGLPLAAFPNARHLQSLCRLTC